MVSKGAAHYFDLDIGMLFLPLSQRRLGNVVHGWVGGHSESLLRLGQRHSQESGQQAGEASTGAHKADLIEGHGFLQRCKSPRFESAFKQL